MNFSIKSELVEKGLKLRLKKELNMMTFREVFDLIKKRDKNFLRKFSELFNLNCPSPDKSFFELPPLKKNSLNQEFQMFFSWEGNGISQADESKFKDKFEANKSLPNKNDYVISFRNFSGDALLVVPCAIPEVIYNYYKNICNFSLNAFSDFSSRRFLVWEEFLVKLIEELEKELTKNPNSPLWVSNTNISGSVPWVHIRISNKPKYYSHQEYKNPNFYNKNNDSDNQNGNNNDNNHGEKNPVQNNQPTDQKFVIFIVLLITLFVSLLFFLVLKLRKRKK